MDASQLLIRNKFIIIIFYYHYHILLSLSYFIISDYFFCAKVKDSANFNKMHESTPESNEQLIVVLLINVLSKIIFMSIFIMIIGNNIVFDLYKHSNGLELIHFFIWNDY